MAKKIKNKINYLLRPFKKSDYKILVRKINHRDIYRNTLHIPYPYKEQDAKKWITEILRRYKSKSPGSYNLAIEVDGEVSGGISLKNIEKEHKAEIGYWLAREYWGQGIMSSAVADMTALGFKKFKLRKVYAYVFTRNKASLRVLVKNGFKKEGLLIQHTKKDGKLLNEFILAKYKHGN
ncbi:MAG: GNAT family N-acetyltransferase [Patescibacteria group bacterium]|jgi:RimJ/RimL family protein N-acetyltransferase